MVPGPKTELVLQKYTEVPDGMGGSEWIYQSARKMKGVLISLRGNERFVTGKTEVFRTHKFVVDFPIGITVTEKDRYTLGVRTFDIQVVADPAEQHRHLEIDLLEIQ
ncbi:hypothetical protein ES703_73639 [subsurface metagenome]